MSKPFKMIQSWWRSRLRSARDVGPYAAVLGLTPIAVPLAAALATVVIYFVPERAPLGWVNDLAVPIGILSGVLVWLLAAIPSQRFANARFANMESYDGIARRLNQIQNRLRRCAGQPYAQPHINLATLTEPDAMRRIAWDEARDCSQAIEAELEPPRGGGVPWSSGTGYLKLWSLIYLAEEALIAIEPLSMVLAGALHDESRIVGSTMDNGQSLLDKLRTALAMLSPEALRYMDKPPATPRPLWGTRSGAEQCEAQARAILREVRFSIDQFRGQRWEGLVRARNARLKTAFVSGVAVYVLIAVAVLSHAPVGAIVAAVVYFLVGGIVGLFNRMYSEFGDDTGVDDYGLSTARLILIPLISGLAAVGGVLITAAFRAAGTTTVLQLTEIYSLSGGPNNLLIAAIFGLVPGLLISSLQQQTDKYKVDLSRSRASNRAPA